MEIINALCLCIVKRELPLQPSDHDVARHSIFVDLEESHGVHSFDVAQLFRKLGFGTIRDAKLRALQETKPTTMKLISRPHDGSTCYELDVDEIKFWSYAALEAYANQYNRHSKQPGR